MGIGVLTHISILPFEVGPPGIQSIPLKSAGLSLPFASSVVVLSARLNQLCVSIPPVCH